MPWSLSSPQQAGLVLGFANTVVYAEHLVLWFANTVMYVASVTALISRSDDEGDVGAYRRGGVTSRRCFNIDSASLRDLASLQCSAYTTVFTNPST